MTQIPIYRAKKIDSDEYVVGFYKNILYFKDKHIITSLVNISGFDGSIQRTNLWDYKDYEIDQSTLAIHYPDMLDSQGNKIFASLSEDGKGGDILKSLHFIEQNGKEHYLNHIAKWSNKYYSITLNNKANISIDNIGDGTGNVFYFSSTRHNEYKVIGIQQ